MRLITKIRELKLNPVCIQKYDLIRVGYLNGILVMALPKITSVMDFDEFKTDMGWERENPKRRTAFTKIDSRAARVRQSEIEAKFSTGPEKIKFRDLGPVDVGVINRMHGRYHAGVSAAIQDGKPVSADKVYSFGFSI